MKPVAQTERKPFAGVDLAAAGRAGGVASGASRRQTPMRELNRVLEEKILKSKSGWAHVRLLEIRMAQQAELDRAEADAARDRALAEQERVETELKEMRAEHAELQATLAEEIRGLEHREAELRQRLEQREQGLSSIDDTALVSWLRDVGSERVEAACETLGWYDEEVTSDETS